MSIRKPFYGEHQIIAGQYTAGNEYVYENGDDYVGTYHVFPNGQMFTGANRNVKSVQIFEKRFDISEDVKIYNRINSLDIGRYTSPVLYLPRPTHSDYRVGKFQRYFIQKRNSPLHTLMEITPEQYNTVNTKNSYGINGVIWQRGTLIWYISLLPADQISVLNEAQIDNISKVMIGIRKILSNNLEFYR